MTELTSTAQQSNNTQDMYPTVSAEPFKGDNSDADNQPSNKRKRDDTVSDRVVDVPLDTLSYALINGGDDDFAGEPVPTKEELSYYCKKLKHGLVASTLSQAEKLRTKLYLAENEVEKLKAQM